MSNGGGIRGDFHKGDVTFRDVVSVLPFGNLLCVAEVTGAELLDMLEYFYRCVDAEYQRDGVAVGEDGSFQQISGLKLTVDTSIPTSVQVDENDTLTGVGDTRRVQDVQVLQDGEYVPLDPEKTYTLAANDYMIKNGGSGMDIYLADNHLVLDAAMEDYQVLSDYIQLLNGDLSQYSQPDSRINIR